MKQIKWYHRELVSQVTSSSLFHFLSIVGSCINHKTSLNFIFLIEEVDVNTCSLFSTPLL